MGVPLAGEEEVVVEGRLLEEREALVVPGS